MLYAGCYPRIHDRGLNPTEALADYWTIASDWFGPTRRLAESLPEVAAQAVVYGGDEPQARRDATAVPLAGFADLLTALDVLPAAPTGDLDA